MKHIGNLEITESNADQYRDLVEVTGDLYVHGSAKLEAPQLTTVGGDLRVHGSAKLEAPQLTTVGGYLYVDGSAKLEALTTVGGYLYVDGSAKLEALTTVGGYLYVDGSAKLEAPQLTTVGGDLYVDGSAKLEALTTVGGYLYVDGSAKLEALTTVGGYLYVDGSAKLEAPQLTTVGGDLRVHGSAKLEALTTVGGDLYVHGSAKLEAPQLKGGNDASAKKTCDLALEASFSLRGLIKIDGILSWILGIKQLGEISVFEIKIVGKLKSSFAVKRGDTYSHGETVEQAIKDLRFKIGNRDTSRFESWKLGTKVSIDDAIQSYRVITGACEFGTKHFCSGIELPEEITIKEIIERTAGQFGNGDYQKFFEARA